MEEALRRINYDGQFAVVETFQTGGILRRHFLVNEKYIDYEVVYTAGRRKAELGCLVDMMPELHSKDRLREIVYYDAKEFKCPDLRINGVLHEVENPSKPQEYNNLKNRIAEGAGQADMVIVNLVEEIGINHRRRVCKGRFIDHPNLLIIEFLFENDFIVVERGEFLYGVKEPLIKV